MNNKTSRYVPPEPYYEESDHEDWESDDNSEEAESPLFV